MIKWIKKMSLLRVSAIILSLLLIVMMGVMAFLMYFGQKSAAYHEFLEVGDALRSQGQASTGLIAPIAAAIDAGEEVPEYEAGIMKMILNGMTDDENMANAYYLSVNSSVSGDGKTYLTNIQISDSLSNAGSRAGAPFEAPPALLEGYMRAVDGASLLTDVYEDEYGRWITFLGSIHDDQGQPIAVLGIDFDYDIVEHQLLTLLLRSLGIGMGAALISIGIVILLLRLAIRPLQVLRDKAKEAAAGDLTVFVPVTSGNEIGQAAESFNEMIDSLRKLTINIQQSAREVGASSINLKETANQTDQATGEINESIQNVAVGTETQLVSSQECQTAMTEMAIGIQRIAESTSVVSELAVDTSKLAVEGGIIIDRTAAQIERLEQQIVIAADSMRELNEYSDRIGDILAHIDEVAGQTNLLALNASIEASRAGEHGRGFAVVAAEIRKLAERSKESSEEISNILHAIGTRSNSLSKSLADSAAEARESTSLASSSGDSFRSIQDAIGQVSSQVQEVSAASEQMSASSEEIAATLEELARIAQSSAGHSQQVAAASEEQLASVQEFTQAAEQLRTLAGDLNDAVSRFRV